MCMEGGLFDRKHCVNVDKLRVSAVIGLKTTLTFKLHERDAH